MASVVLSSVSLTESLLRLARRVALLGVWAGGVLMIVTAFVVGFEVIGRKLFNVSTGGTDEIAGIALAISTAWALPLALLDRAHIRIDSLYALLPTRAAAVLDLVGLTAFGLFTGMITWYGFTVVATSYRLGSRSLSAIGYPVVVPQFLWLAGFAFFLIVIVLLLIRGIVLFVQGDLRAARGLIGSRTLDEETADELADVTVRRDVP
ncbi:TRAP transporter small permease subunit [Marinivivus vitaminiproducens]|uniref:TRAP transporter small permease subunit n=1 Tax=Marinivivus vitaminiproducens TaxID=3035935 RepID=UPI0027AA4245|nr:TRAP transporter small permease [Geminicoccaceae bacterium SCSIO 64248]